MKLKLNELIARAHLMIAAPSTVIELNRLMQDSNSSVSDFAECIERDPSVAVKLLKIVNSPYYGAPGKIDSIPQAISMLGTQDLRDLATATCLVNSFSKLKNEVVAAEQFWRHSFFVGVIAKVLGESRGAVYTDRYFTAGLLHDIGSLLLYQFAPQESRVIIEKSREMHLHPYQLENSQFGFTSAQVGAELVHRWNLPGHLEEAIRYHQQPELAQNHVIDASVVHIANRLATAVDLRSSLLGRIDPIHQEHWNTIGMSPEVLINARETIVHRFEEMTKLILPDNLAA